MGAPKDNKFWMRRKDMTPDGRKLSIQELATEAKKYFEQIENNPAIDEDYKGNPPQKVSIEKRRGMSIEGLCSFVGIVTSTLDEWEKDEKYSGLVRYIKQEIKAWNLDGAFTGQLNSSIVQRMHGLGDKINLDVVDNRKAVADAFPEELED